MSRISEVVAVVLFYMSLVSVVFWGMDKLIDYFSDD